MDAGRELDALVAERVMGFTRFISADHTHDSTPIARSFGIVYGWKNTHGVFTGHDTPGYSTDIAAAWLVIEHMEQGLWALTLVRGRDGDGLLSDEWQATFSDPEASFDAVKRSAAHAICLAALKALGAL